jgi:hypothetical protein
MRIDCPEQRAALLRTYVPVQGAVDSHITSKTPQRAVAWITDEMALLAASLTGPSFGWNR